MAGENIQIVSPISENQNYVVANYLKMMCYVEEKIPNDILHNTQYCDDKNKHILDVSYN